VFLSSVNPEAPMTHHRHIPRRGGREDLLRLAAAAAGALLGCAALPAADEPKDDEAARQRLEFMTRKLDQLVLSTEKAPGQPLSRTKEPVLRYTNPARGVHADGALFVWHSGGRPAAVAALRVRPDGAVWREFTSLSEQGLRCEREGQVVWSPRPGGLARKPLPDAPEPASTPALRLAQMRRLAERFSAEFDHLSAGRWEELRLMPQPLYRYAADKGAAEGAIFALAQSNDPEALLILELARPAADAPPAWGYALARMSSQPMRVRLDGKEVWSVNGYWSNPRSREDPYQEAADGKFPGADPAGPPPRKK
jgi:hypothetical protein